jgi:2,5-diamino-6-(ribosylamino)-4(3H)-pyrimidinone 5'-phosphate reductase
MRTTRRDGTITFRSRRTDSEAAFQARYRPVGEPYRAEPGSLESFCIEEFHHLSPGTENRRSRASGDRDRLRVGTIEREPWTPRPVEATIRRNTLFEAAGLPTPPTDLVTQHARTFEMRVEPVESVSVFSEACTDRKLFDRWPGVMGMETVVNAATSVDGKLSTRQRRQVRISGDADFDRVDRLRAAADAVLVGVGTVLADDPHLGVKSEDRRAERLRNGRAANPARVVADSRARTPPDATVLDDDADTYLLVSAAAPADRLDRLRSAGATVIEAGTERVDLQTAFETLDAEGPDRLLAEGGGELIFSLFEAGLVDELSAFVGSILVGGRDAPTLADGEGFVDDFPALDLVSVDRLDDGVVLRYQVVSD